MQNNHPCPEREKAVFRTVPIPASAFDHIKDTQRAIQARTGRAVTFNEVFATIVHEHKQHQGAPRTDRPNATAAVFQPRA